MSRNDRCYLIMQKFNLTTIQTSRLLLRPLERSDCDDLFSLRSHPEVNRYTGNTPFATVESAKEMIERDINAMDEGEYVRFALIRDSDSKLIGTCGLFHFDEQCRRAEIGYDLHPDVWGRGYINEALVPLINLGFAEMDLNRIEADVDPLNASSIKTLERLGFKKEGFLRERWIVNGVKADTAFYGLLLSDWKSM